MLTMVAFSPLSPVLLQEIDPSAKFRSNTPGSNSQVPLKAFTNQILDQVHEIMAGAKICVVYLYLLDQENPCATFEALNSSETVLD